MTKPTLTLKDLNEALLVLSEPIYCRHCRKEIGWTGVNWIHKHQPVGHLAEPHGKTYSPSGMKNLFSKLIDKSSADKA